MKKRKPQDVRKRIQQQIDEIDEAYLPLIEERLDIFIAKTEGDGRHSWKK